MPASAPRPCSWPGCPDLAVRGSRCDDHAAVAARRKGSATSRGYDAAWRRVRSRHLRLHPLCEEPGCSALATVVDHIETIRDAPHLRLDHGNLRSYCALHHNHRTARDQPGGWHQPT